MNNKELMDLIFQDFEHNYEILEQMSDEYEELSGIGYLELKMIALHASFIKMNAAIKTIKGDY